MILRKVKSVEIIPARPFNFDATFYKPDHFTSGDNCWKAGVRWQTWRWGKKGLGLKIINVGTVDLPKVILEIFSSGKLKQSLINGLVKEIKYLYNFDLDLAPFYKKFDGDEVLGPIIKNWRGLRPGQPSSLYEYLIIGIVLQNATVRRSIQMFKALLENFGTPLEYDKKKLLCFWEPGRLSSVTEQKLRDLKMGYRAKSIKRVDDYFATGMIDEVGLRGESVEAQKQELLKIYGVGPATVWYIMFDVFHRWDTFEHVSPWEQRIYTKLFFDKDPDKPESADKILKYISRYKPYRALAVHYIWEDLWWKRKNQSIPWLEKLIRV
jgi:3-methyladenine DNA glycosylase/8-oxoguanine DNA glycosylase